MALCLKDLRVLAKLCQGFLPLRHEFLDLICYSRYVSRKLLAALKGQNMSNASVIVWRMSNLAWQEGAMKKSSHACNVIELPN